MITSVSFDMVLLQELIGHAEHCQEAEFDVLRQRMEEAPGDDDRIIQSCRVVVAWHDLLQGLKDCRR
jgi:hypothetical protein